jgi:hypothetical protein
MTNNILYDDDLAKKKIIQKAIDKNKLLDAKSCINGYVNICYICNTDGDIAKITDGIVALSIVENAMKILKDKEFIEWCEKNVKEEKDV